MISEVTEHVSCDPAKHKTNTNWRNPMHPVKGLFVPGPTNVPEAVRKAIDIPMEDHRAPDLADFTLPLFADLKQIFKTTTGEVFLYPASGTGGWEAAITNTLSPGDRVLAARYGQFSHLWIDLCQRHGLDVDVVDVEWGEGVPTEIFADRLAADAERKIKAVLVCQNETATGVQSDVRRFSARRTQRRRTPGPALR